MIFPTGAEVSTSSSCNCFMPQIDTSCLSLYHASLLKIFPVYSSNTSLNSPDILHGPLACLISFNFVGTSQISSERGHSYSVLGNGGLSCAKALVESCRDTLITYNLIWDLFHVYIDNLLIVGGYWLMFSNCLTSKTAIKAQGYMIVECFFVAPYTKNACASIALYTKQLNRKSHLSDHNVHSRPWMLEHLFVYVYDINCVIRGRNAWTFWKPLRGCHTSL